MANGRKIIKISIDVLRRFKDYCDEYNESTLNKAWDYRADKEKEFIREILGRNYNKNMRMIEFQDRKKMLNVIVSLEFLEKMKVYIDNFMHHCTYLEEYKDAIEDYMRVQRWIRMFDRRNRARRKVIKLNIKDAMNEIEEYNRPVKVAV